MNPGALMRAPVFLPDLQTPQNARAAVSSFTLLFDAVTVSFQLPLVGISGRSAGAPPVQARTMCIKCARVFHKEEMAYTCNATFHWQLHQRPNRRGPRNGKEIPGHRRAQNSAKEGFWWGVQGAQSGSSARPIPSFFLSSLLWNFSFQEIRGGHTSRLSTILLGTQHSLTYQWRDKPFQQTHRQESKFYQKSWEHLYNQPYASQYKSSGQLSTLSHSDCIINWLLEWLSTAFGATDHCTTDFYHAKTAEKYDTYKNYNRNEMKSRRTWRLGHL